MGSDWLTKNGFLSWEDNLENTEFSLVSPGDLRNESLAYLLGKWLRSLHMGIPEHCETGNLTIPALQEIWTPETAGKLIDRFCWDYSPGQKQDLSLERMKRLEKTIDRFVLAYRNLPQVYSFRAFDKEHILVNRNRTTAMVRIDPAIGYRYADIRRICSCLQFWGQWAFLWGYAVPISEQEKQLDRISEILYEIRTEGEKEQPDFGRACRLLNDPVTGKALDRLEEEQDDNRAV